MKSLIGILPFAVVLVIAGAAIWWMLSRDMGAGRWLLAAVLIGHAVVHVMFALPESVAADAGPAWPFTMAGSWLVAPAGLDVNVVRAIGMTLIAIIGIGFVIAAGSTVGLVVPAGWWPGAVVVSSLASAVMLVLFFDLQLVLGLGIDALLVWVAAAGLWAP